MSQLNQFESGESIYDEGFREKLNAVVDAVNASGSGTNAAPRGFNESRAHRGIPVELLARTSEGGGEFSFREVIWNQDTGSWETKANGLTHQQLGAARAMGGTVTTAVAAAHIGDVVYIYPKCIPDNNTVRYEFNVSPKLFPVNVVVKSGVNGVAGVSPPTWIYDIYDKDDNLLEEDLTPENPRQNHAYVKASAGLAYIDTDGSWKLATVFEEVVPPSPTGDNVGYWQVEANSPYGNGVTASELVAGKIEFKSRNNAGEIPIYTEITDGAGTDEVLQYVKASDIPSSGADGQGYEDVHYNGVSQEAITDGGILDFDDQQTPSAGGVVVDWTITGNGAGTAKVQGEVDLSAVTGSSGTLGGLKVLDALIEINEGASTGTKVLSSADWRGTIITVSQYGVYTTDTTARTTAFDDDGAGGSIQSYYVGSALASDLSLGSYTGGAVVFYVRASDGNIIMVINTAPAIASFPDPPNVGLIRFQVIGGASRSSANFTYP